VRGIGRTLGLVSGFALCVVGSIYGQELPEGQEGQTGPSLLEQVYENRFTILRDSLFVRQEQLDAANFMVGQLETQIGGLADSLALTLQQTRQLTDSLSHMRILYDRIIIQNRQHQARLSALSDSAMQSYAREYALQARNDSLLAISAQAQVYLVNLDSTEGAYADSMMALENALEEVQEKLRTSEERLAGLSEQITGAMVAYEPALLDTAADRRLLAYLNKMSSYRVEPKGFTGFIFGGDQKGSVQAYRQNALRRYLEWSGLQGNTPQALNILAREYIQQGDVILGTLTFFKTIFLYPESEESVRARGEVEQLVTKSSEEGQLFFDVVQNPDSLNVGADRLYRYLNYLDHIRILQHPTAKTWFIVEAERFMQLYPGVFQADMIHMWIAETYHGLREYHNEILTYMKLHTIYPYSSYVPEAMFAIAEVASRDLHDYAGAIRGYREFREQFPNHDRAPIALFNEASIYEEELKDYVQSGSLYTQLAEEYPEHELAPAGLFKYAAILHRRLGSPENAIIVYEDILESYSRQPETGILALENLAKIAEDRKQYDAAVVYYLDIRERYPDRNEQVVAGIIEAANIYQSKLKNIDATIHTLHLIVDNYPDYPGIKSIQRRIQKLQRKRG